MKTRWSDFCGPCRRPRPRASTALAARPVALNHSFAGGRAVRRWLHDFRGKALVVVLLPALYAAGAVASEAALAALERAPHVPDEVLVQYRPGVALGDRAQARGRIGGALRETVAAGATRTDGEGELELVRLPPGIAIAEAVRGLEQDVAVEYAEPNWIYVHSATSNDTYYTKGSLWGMYGDGTAPANPYGSRAGEAWAAAHTGSRSVYIGIIDEGVMYNHVDLASNIFTNPYDPANGVDDDGNGYVDDLRGWDFVNNDNSIYDGTTDDHGTHVAGTIGALGGNGKGVAGVVWNVTLIVAKFLGSNGGTTANAIKALDYLADLKTRHGLNIVATSNSWGGGGFSQSLQDAIERANAVEILFVAAAGNNGSNNDATPYYPASYSNSNIISVAALTSQGKRASFSNYGATTVDLGAPGSGIYSTVPGKNNGSGYASYSGTSQAVPHVTGAIALNAATRPDASAADFKAAILGSTLPTPALAGKCVTGGRLNIEAF